MKISTIFIYFVVFLIIITVPALPGIALLYYLQPHTFWEKVVWIWMAAVMYVAVLLLFMKSYEVFKL